MAQMSPRSKKAFSWFFISIGIFAVSAGIWNVARSLRCRSWPVATGTVLDARMQIHRRVGPHSSTTYFPKISYSYQVEETHYTGTRVVFGEMWASPAYAQKILDRFPAGINVPVHYSPRNPALAVLETTIGEGSWLCLGIGVMFTLVGVFYLQGLPQEATLPRATNDAPLPTPSGPGQIPLTACLLFLCMGFFTCAFQALEGAGRWSDYAPGGAIALFGLLLLAARLQTPILFMAGKWIFFLSFMTFLHWFTFHCPDRLFTVSIGAFTFFIDFILVAGLVQWVTKGKSPFL